MELRDVPRTSSVPPRGLSGGAYAPAHHPPTTRYARAAWAHVRGARQFTGAALSGPSTPPPGPWEEGRG